LKKVPFQKLPGSGLNPVFARFFFDFPMAALLRLTGIMTGVAIARRATASRDATSTGERDTSIEAFLRSAAEGDANAFDGAELTAPLVPWRRISGRGRCCILMCAVFPVFWTGNVAFGLILALVTFLLVASRRR
jgi:hypothetical protein